MGNININTVVGKTINIFQGEDFENTLRSKVGNSFIPLNYTSFEGGITAHAADTSYLVQFTFTPTTVDGIAAMVFSLSNTQTRDLVTLIDPEKTIVQLGRYDITGTNITTGKKKRIREGAVMFHRKAKAP